MSARAEIERREEELPERFPYKERVKIFHLFIDYFSTIEESTPHRQQRLFKKMAKANGNKLCQRAEKATLEECEKIFRSALYGKLNEEESAIKLLGGAYRESEMIKQLWEKRWPFAKVWDALLSSDPEAAGTFTSSEAVQIHKEIVTREFLSLMQKVRAKRRVTLSLHTPEIPPKEGGPIWKNYEIKASCAFDYNCVVEISKRYNYLPIMAARLEIHAERGSERGKATLLFHRKGNSLQVSHFHAVVLESGRRETKEAAEKAAYHLLAELLSKSGNGIDELLLMEEEAVTCEDSLAKSSYFTPPLKANPRLFGAQYARGFTLRREEAMKLIARDGPLLDIGELLSRSPLALQLAVEENGRENIVDVALAKRENSLTATAIHFSPKLSKLESERKNGQSDPLPIVKSLFLYLSELLVQLGKYGELLLPRSDSVEIEGSSAALMLNIDSPILLSDERGKLLAWRLSLDRAKELTKGLKLDVLPF